jgi:hypothetical protein
VDSIIEYIENRLEPFSTLPFNAVDSLILAEFSYIRLDHIVPALSWWRAPVKICELAKAELFPSMFKTARDIEKSRSFVYALAASPRFRNIRVHYYVNNTDPVLEKQFSACTFFLEDKSAYIAYRGTDSTYVGWKEDFNMAYMSSVPAQQEGVKYLNAVARRIPKSTRLRVGGHSKGGNIAVYSAVKCDVSVQKRIVSVFNHDGPGFKDNIFSSAEFIRMKDRIFTTIPEEAVVGMLLQHHETYQVIKSSAHGIMQHDPFTWNIEQNDFSYSNKVKYSASLRSKIISEWLDSLSDEKRKMFVDELFRILESTETESFHELSLDWPKKAQLVLSSVRAIDPEVKKFLLSTLNELGQLTVRNFFTDK